MTGYIDNIKVDYEYSAIGGAIKHIGNIHKYARPEDVPEHTMFIITQIARGTRILYESFSAPISAMRANLTISEDW